MIVVVDLENYSVDTFDDLVPETVCPGQLEWISDDTLVGIGLISTPYRLGAIYCSNRPAGIFQLDLCCKAFQWIREPTNITCRHPKVNPSLKKLVYFEADLHQDLYPGPHERCFRYTHNYYFLIVFLFGRCCYTSRSEKYSATLTTITFLYYLMYFV